MLNLEKDEKVLLVLHHHWISFLGPLVILVSLALAPLLLIPFIATQPTLTYLFLFLSTLWYLMVLFLALGFWIDYYLDALVVTDRRVLNVNQSGLFKHVVSEFKIDKVQDVTIEVTNFMGTFFHFGNITIQTAGEVSFSINEVPSPHTARDIILKQAKDRANL